MNNRKYLVIVVVLVAVNIFMLIKFYGLKQNTVKDAAMNSNQATIEYGELNAYKVKFLASTAFGIYCGSRYTVRQPVYLVLSIAIFPQLLGSFGNIILLVSRS